VCGRLRGYQVGRSDAFGPYVNDQTNADVVVDGVMISHGSAKSHIWVYATGNHRTPSSQSNIVCPSADPRFNGVVPAFIGNDYYCAYSNTIMKKDLTTLFVIVSYTQFQD